MSAKETAWAMMEKAEGCTGEERAFLIQEAFRWMRIHKEQEAKCSCGCGLSVR